MELVEAGGQAEICELDVAASVEQDIVWLDVSVDVFVLASVQHIKQRALTGE